MFGVDTVGIFRYRSPTPRRENLHAPLVRTVEKERHSRYLPCAGLSPLSRAEQLWGSPLPGERVRRSVVLTVYVSDLPRLASVCEVLQNRYAFGICAQGPPIGTHSCRSTVLQRAWNRLRRCTAPGRAAMPASTPRECRHTLLRCSWSLIP